MMANATSRFRRWPALAYFGPVPVVAAVLIAAAVVSQAWPHLRGHTPYPDVVAGVLASTDADKGIDMRAAALLGATVVAVAGGFGVAFRRVAPDGPASPVGRALNGALLTSLAPAAFRLTVALLHPVDRLPPVLLLATFPAGVGAVVLLLGRYPLRSVRASDVLVCCGAAVLAVVFAAMSAVVALTAVERVAGRMAVVSFVAVHVSAAATVVAAMAVLGIGGAWAASPAVRRFRRRLLVGLVVSQLPLPLGLLYLVPPPLFDQSHRFTVHYPRLLVGVLSVLAAWGVWTVARRLWRRPVTLRAAVAPAAVIALAVFAHCPTAEVPAASRDYFHFGEQVLPWEQLRDFGKVPYADFVPIHGLMAFLRGGLNQVFFAGTEAHYSEADCLLAGVAAAANAAGAGWLLGPAAALALLAVPLPEFDRLFLLPAGLFVAAAPRTWRRPAWGLIGWAGVCAVELAYNASVGPAFVVATAPVAAWAAWRGRWRGTLAAAGAIVALVVAVAAVPAGRTMGFGFVRFVADNAWTNTTAHAIPWSAGVNHRDIRTGFGSSQALWETARMGWVGVAVTAAWLAWRAAAGRPGRRGLVPLAVGTAVLLPMLFPWTMGRIAAGEFSRPGALSTTSVEYLLPALLLLAVPVRRGAVALVAAGLVAAGVQYGDTTVLDPPATLAKASDVRIIPADATVVDGASLGLPGVGQVVASPAARLWLADLADLHRGLDRLLGPGETFLDLTEQQGIYYYLGLPVPVRYVAYVAANGRLQAGELRQLAAHPVPAVMVGPSAWFDGFPPSLRCYQLWRAYALRDVPVRIGTFTFLVDPVRAARFNGTPPPPPGVWPTVTEQWLQTLDTYDRPDDLHRLPIAWGRSWATLADRFQVMGKGAVESQATAADPWATVAVPTATVPDGAAADFVKLHVSLTPADPAAYAAAVDGDPVPNDVPTAAEPEMVLQWQDVSGAWPQAAAHFKVHDGTLVVPLGVFPRWLLGRGSPAIRMCVLNPSSVKSWRLDGAAFLRLKPL